MFAVIFKAKVKHLDQAYIDTAKRMRDRALNEFNCVDFIAACEGDQEIAISYWQSEADIAAWRNDSEHQLAQQHGKRDWYSSYEVEVVELRRQYTSKG